MRSAVIGFSKRNRARKARIILEFMAAESVRTAIFVGCSPGSNANEQIVEDAVARSADVLAACDLLVSAGSWPFVLADGRALPFRSKATDLVVANAVIEHVGDEAEQRTFVAEQTRVGRTWVITTPNRWFPVESHTSALLRHYSARWRAEHSQFTRLLSLREFTDLLPDGTVIHGRPWSATFTALYSDRTASPYAAARITSPSPASPRRTRMPRNRPARRRPSSARS